MLAKNSANILASTTIYVRYKPTTAGVDSGYVKCTSLNATLKKVKVKGTSTVRLENGVDFSADVILSPNPAITSLNILNVSGEKTTVTIYDLLGSKITSQVFVADDEMNLPVEFLKSGLYVCRIENENGVYTKRFIKQ